MRPTLFIGVPRVFDRIYAGVLAKVKAGGAIKKYLFDYAYKHKLYYLNQGYPHDKVHFHIFQSCQQADTVLPVFCPTP